MAAADTARLIASLELKDKFTGPSNKVLGSLGRLEGGINRIGNLAQQGARTAATNVAKIGVVAAAGIAANVKLGLDSLAQLESAVTSVDGAIETLGLTGQLTGKQVADWANQIERDVGAAFDDKEITAAAATLLRFGKVTPKNLRPALEVMTDLAAKTGDVDSAASLLAKALADPTKAAGKLARQGIILTKAQQDQIKALVEAGDAAGAQRVILDQLAKSTEGAARASQGPYARSIAVLKDVTEDAQKALAVGFLPVIQKVSDLLGRELAKPETLANIQKFGEGLAGGLDSLISVAQRLPWQQIGDSLKLGAAGATAILDAFTKLPPWVQTAVLTGWGLNKLTGGALGGIVSELSKGLIKGVLGINAGVVNVNARTVAGAGGGAASGATSGGKGTVGKVGSVIGGVAKVFMVGAAVGIFAELLQGRNEQAEQNRQLTEATKQQGAAFANSASIREMQRALAGIEAYDRKLTSELTPEAIAYQLNIDGVRTTVEGEMARLRAAIAAEEQKNRFGFTEAQAAQAGRQNITNERLESIRAQQVADAAKIAAGVKDTATETAAVRTAAVGLIRDTNAELAGVRASSAAAAAKIGDTNSELRSVQRAAANNAAYTRAGLADVRGAIASKKFSVTNNITVPVRVSVAETIKTQTTFKQMHRVIS